MSRRTPREATSNRSRRTSNQTRFLIVWWMSQTPHAALFDNRIAAEVAARVRNALLVTLAGSDVEVDAIEDYYRRDDDDHPMPAEWRDLVGQAHAPWSRAGQPAEAMA